MHYVGTIRLVVLLAIAASLPLWLQSGPSPKARSIRASFDRTIVGSAYVIDGDTIDVAGTRIRLYGIDAPESSQTCMSANKSYRCGESATRALANLVQGREVRCDPTGMDRYRRMIARCYITGDNLSISAWMVREGLAVAYRQYSYTYMPDEILPYRATMGTRRSPRTRTCSISQESNATMPSAMTWISRELVAT
jgi:endonuclease YncB( thermonuclease family)